MSEKDFLIKTIDKKEKKLKRAIIENVGFAGIIGAIVGYVFSEAYTGCMVNGTITQIAIIALFTAIGTTIGYLDGKAKAEELRLDVMLLQDLNARL